MEDTAVWIERWALPRGTGPVVGVKDLCDVEGSVTTAGSRALAARGVAASADAACVAAVRRAGGRLAGKTNLHELAYGTSGANPWYGMPDNPTDPGRVPGGSSSGSAVAVARGECDVAVGSDTGGSIRIPAACCGIVGLKTTWGRIPLEGVWPLAPSFDTIGPMARDVAGAATGLDLLEGRPPGTAGGRPSPPASIGLARLGEEIHIDAAIDRSVDAAVESTGRLSGLEVLAVHLEGWKAAWKAHSVLLDAEAWESDRSLLEDGAGRGVGAEVSARLLAASKHSPDAIEAARLVRASFCDKLLAAVESCGVLALPALPWRPPTVEDWRGGFN
ncbi:MAG: amidase, partial [Acidimicrobiales bacterium]